MIHICAYKLKLSLKIRRSIHDCQNYVCMFVGEERERDSKSKIQWNAEWMRIKNIEKLQFELCLVLNTFVWECVAESESSMRLFFEIYCESVSYSLSLRECLLLYPLGLWLRNPKTLFCQHTFVGICVHQCVCACVWLRESKQNFPKTKLAPTKTK